VAEAASGRGEVDTVRGGKWDAQSSRRARRETGLRGRVMRLLAE